MTGAERNVRLYPWFRFFQNLLFWQAVWFLYFQNELSAAEAILFYAIYDLATTILEVPSGWMSDRLGRRITLILSAATGTVAVLVLALGGSFWMFAAGQVLMGGAIALASGTDTAFLYESLEEAGIADRVEAEELRAWRYNFTALAVSAVIGGAIALYSFVLTFLLSAVAQAIMLLIALRFVEPSKRRHDAVTGAEWARAASLGAAFRKPVLLWLFALNVLMYGFSHVPFVFGQPVIEQVLKPLGWAAEAPLVSGAVTTAMMLVSVAVSLRAPWVRKRLGLAGVLLLAFAMQVGLIAVLAATKSVAAILVLLLRMVPSSLSTPFILARIQPELESTSRATFLSVKSLVGRIVFAGSLWLAAGAAGGVGALSYDEMRPILLAYAVVGSAAFLLLWATAGRVPLERSSGPADQNH